eukprot:m51a1_g2669 hypothetical protein (1193) ;mRNA; f:711285-715971
MDAVAKRLARSEGGVVNLSALGLSVVPQAISTVRRVRHVNLSRNHFIDLEDVEAFGKVVGLNMSHNHLTAVPEPLARIASLEDLDLSYNKLTGELGDSAFIQSLVVLDLSFNRLTSVKAEISALASLRSLNLSHNELVSLPPALPASLTSLNVSDNMLRRLPAQIGDLKALSRLDVSHNRLSHLPPSIKGAEDLKELLTAGNPWICPRASVCDAGAAAVFAELSRLANAHADPLYTGITGLADCIVGKTISFQVIARDSSNVARIAGGDDVAVSVKGPGRTKTKVNDLGDGTYKVEATPSAPGLYTVLATVGGTLVGCGPVAFSALAGEDTGYEPEDLDTVSPGEEGKPHLEAFAFGHGDVFAQFSELQRLSRELNVPLSVPEVVVCGERGYETLAELIWGVFPLDLASRAPLGRPVHLNIVCNSEAKEPRLTLKRDRLLGANVSGGMRDMTVALDALPEMLEQRVHESSAVPVNLIYESCSVITCNIIFAPAIPAIDAPERILAEEILLDLIAPTHRTVVCVTPSIHWNLLQTSQWLTWLTSVDTNLRRSIFAFTRFSPLVSSYNNARDLQEFISGRPTAFATFFVSLLGREARASCATADDYKLRLWQASQLDVRALEALSYDKSLDSSLGAHSLRAFVYRRIVRQYHSELPALQQRLANLSQDAQSSLALVKDQVLSLRAATLPNQLRLALSNFTLRFTGFVAQLLRGTVEGSRADLGQTFAEEAAEMQSITPLFLAAQDVQNAECRLYGGAQLVRALDNFKRCAANVTMNPAVASECLGATNAISMAAQLAQREVRAGLAPLIEQLCLQSSYIIERIAQIVESLVTPTAAQRANTSKPFIDRVVEFSYLLKNVRELFMEIVEQRISSFKAKCFEDFSSSTTLWDLPSITIDAEMQNNMQKLADNIHVQLRDRLTEGVVARFYSIMLQGVATSVPTEMHSTLMSLKDAHLLNFFQLGALEDNLLTSQERLEAQISGLDTKKDTVLDVRPVFSLADDLVWARIASALPLRDVGSFAVCNRRMYVITCSEFLWKLKTRLDFGMRELPKEHTSWRVYYRTLCTFTGVFHESWANVFTTDIITLAPNRATGIKASMNGAWEVTECFFDGTTLRFCAKGGASRWSFVYEARMLGSAADSDQHPHGVLRLRVQRTHPDPRQFWGFLLRSDIRHDSIFMKPVWSQTPRMYENDVWA